MPKSSEVTIRILATGVNYPDPDNKGQEIRVEAGESIDTATLAPKVLAALNEMQVWADVDTDASTADPVPLLTTPVAPATDSTFPNPTDAIGSDDA